MPKVHVMRLFLALGWQVPTLPSPSIYKEVVIDAHCRPHSQGLDVYLRPGAHHASVPLGPTEFRARVVWYPDLPCGSAHGRAALSSPLLRKMHRPAPRTQCCNRPSAPGVTLFGLQVVVWKDGRYTAVPTSAVVEPGPGEPLQLQVFLYDWLSWWQVAQTEADGRLGPDVKATTTAPPAALPGPLPLRLALRPCGNPDLRGPRWSTELPSVPLAGSVATAGVKGPPAATSTTASKLLALEAAALPSAPLQRAPVPVSPFLLGPLQAVGRAAEFAIQHSATVTHAQHIVACIGALYDMYGRHLGPWNVPAADPWILTGRRCSGESPEHRTTNHQAVAAAEAAWRSPKGPHEVMTASAASSLRPQLRRPRSHAKKRDAEDVKRVAAVGKGGGGGHRTPTVTGNTVSGATNGLTSSPQPSLLHRGQTALAVHIQVLSLLMQLLLGPIVAVAVWRRRKVLMSAAEQVTASTERLLREQYDWLMTATPAGVKLHAELCALLGTVAHFILRLSAAAGRWGWPRCGAAVLGLLATGSAVGGLGAFLAILHDLLLVASSLITLQAVLSGTLIRRQLAWLRTAWRLMRGKQRTGRRRGRKTVAPPSPAPVPLEAGKVETRGGRLEGSCVSKGEASEAMFHDPADGHHHIRTQQNPQARVTANRHPNEEEEVEEQQQQQQQPSVAVSAAKAAVQRAHGVMAHKLRVDPLSGLLTLRGSLAASGGQAVQGPLMPISRLESLLGLAPDPGSDDEVVVEQLIVGVLLLVPLLALLPTTAAWHLLALAAWGVPAAARYGLVLAVGLLRDNVLLALTWRALRPLDFSGPEVMVHSIHERTRARQVMGSCPGTGKSDTAGSEVRCDPSSSKSGLMFVVEPLPLSWRSLTGAWLLRGLQRRQVQPIQERERDGRRG
ncbi:hypothetical protein VaNZ11_007235 [Volvox africanus]|uniref:Uncharacterized protein n=1 Tax=Volvox africanus TaxID=51714 RepID=A0ABQ5S3C5_9CHLO|nr:hypothetical protein VaNZ11_007235 [Volvox africanus]